MATSPEELLTDKQLTIAETLPVDWSFLDDYQAAASAMAIRDEDGRTIRGKQPYQYMLDGLNEEVNEVLFDADKVEPGYNRFGALALLGADNGLKMEPGTVTVTSVERHLKEFGDVAWYLANLLDLCQLDYSATIEPGLAAIRLKRLASEATGRCSPSGHDMIERQAAGVFLYPAIASELRSAASGLAKPAMGQIPAATYLQRRSERALADERFVIAAGQYTVMAQHVLVNRFGSDYQAILDMNLAKLNKRIATQTIFDKTGGDDR